MLETLVANGLPGKLTDCLFLKNMVCCTPSRNIIQQFINNSLGTSVSVVIVLTYHRSQEETGSTSLSWHDLHDLPAAIILCPSTDASSKEKLACGASTLSNHIDVFTTACADGISLSSDLEASGAGEGATMSRTRKVAKRTYLLILSTAMPFDSAALEFSILFLR